MSQYGQFFRIAIHLQKNALRSFRLSLETFNAEGVEVIMLRLNSIQ